MSMTLDFLFFFVQTDPDRRPKLKGGMAKSNAQNSGFTIVTTLMKLSE